MLRTTFVAACESLSRFERYVVSLSELRVPFPSRMEPFIAKAFRLSCERSRVKVCPLCPKS